MTNDEIWYTSDLHLGHERIIELCDRPYGSVGEMNRDLVGRINDTVGDRGSLVILGDVIMGIFEETVKLLAEIKARKIVIFPGNHDRSSLAYRHGGAAEVVRSKRELWRLRYEEARPGVRMLPDRQPSAWHRVVDGRPVVLSHYPYVGDSLGGRDRHRELRPVDEGLPLIHGHVHGRWRVGPGGQMFNVGVDVNGFAPVPEAVVAGWLADVPMGAVRV